MRGSSGGWGARWPTLAVVGAAALACATPVTHEDGRWRARESGASVADLPALEPGWRRTESPGALLAFGAGDGARHSALDARLGPDRNVRLHPALPEREAAVAVRRVDRTPHPILVVLHVAVGHRDGVDVRIDERRVPRDGVRDAVDVVPPPRIEPDEARRERRANLHELERRLELFDEHVRFHRAGPQIEMRLERGQHVVPERGFLGRLDLRQVQHQRRIVSPQPAMVVHDVQRGIDD
jgi:hypothetical protein